MQFDCIVLNERARTQVVGCDKLIKAPAGIDVGVLKSMIFAGSNHIKTGIGTAGTQKPNFERGHSVPAFDGFIEILRNH